MNGPDRGTAAIEEALASRYHLCVARVEALAGGTETDNFRAETGVGTPWFVKVYRPHADLDADLAAIELAQFARDGDVPVPAVLPSATGALLDTGGPRAMSVWAYLEDTETAEGRLHGRRWQSTGAALARLHRRLAAHPAASPELRPGPEVADLARAARRYDHALDAYQHRPPQTGFEQWALEVLHARKDMLPRLSVLAEKLSPLTFQVLHGDLSGPNLLLRESEVAGIIDFRPPSVRAVCWEVSRIALDPRTVLEQPDWQQGLVDLAVAYQEHCPEVRADDLVQVPGTALLYAAHSVYPLTEPLETPSNVDASTERYGRARHDLVGVLWEQLEETEDALRAALT